MFPIRGTSPTSNSSGSAKPAGLVVVVGASGAFGRVIAQRLLSEGFDILAVARNRSLLEQLQISMPAIRICTADIASDTAIDAIRNCIGQPVRAIVHGPGVGVAGGVMDADLAILNEAVNIKVGGILRVVRAVDAQLQRGARIIAIGGQYGLEPTACAASAGVANAALVNVVRQLSLAYGARGITAHTIAPGPAKTERLNRVAAIMAERDGTSLDVALDALRADSSIGAFTTPDQVAWAVSMLLDPHAAAMTGSTLMLDSGRRRGLP